MRNKETKPFNNNNNKFKVNGMIDFMFRKAYQIMMFCKTNSVNPTDYQ
jgi:hypothetical protein